MGVRVREKVPGSGEWWVFITHKGKRKSKKTGRDKRQAFKIAEKIKAQLALGDMGLLKEEKKVKTFGEYAEMWIEVAVPATCKVGTRDIYRSIFKKHVSPTFKNKPIVEVNRHDVKTFLMGKIAEGLGTTTVNNMKNVISGVLNMALDDGVITVNPAQKLGRILKQKDLKLVVEPLSKAETSLLLDAIKEHYPREYPMALTLARTGMRIGEVCALQWGDIDFNSRFIIVQRSMLNNGHVDLPKNNRSRRVDMSAQLTTTLLELRKQRRIEAVKKGWGRMPDWVFISSTGKPVRKEGWREGTFFKALEKVGLRRVRIHDLRHGFASQLLQAGEPLLYVKDQLGHSSIRLTVDIYGHLAPGGNRAAVDRLDDAPFSTLSAPKEEMVNVNN